MSRAPRQDSLRITEGTNSFWPNIEVKPKIRRVLAVEMPDGLPVHSASDRRSRRIEPTIR
jgi:hypothetical protein